MTDYTLTHDVLDGDLPSLAVARAGLADDAPRVLVLHGLGSHKERMLAGLYALAQRGLRAFALDLRLHGERAGAAGHEAALRADFFGTTTEIILGTAGDVSRALDACEARHGPAPAGIHGISLGGYVSFAALLSEPRLLAASVALGSPDWLAPLRAFGLGPGHPAYDLAARQSPLVLAPDVYPPRPLLLLHGALDTVVPPEGVIALESRLRPAYAAHPERLSLRLYPDLGHEYTAEMQTLTTEWLEKYLGAGARPAAPSSLTPAGGP